ncbi:DUF1330 domain-containing protein [Caulobacter sp. 17J65-9]|uniref:DUF1330 domain-containing protein n=1 Tax=Caulobacter sp. 17J65-9 TaxID=2709382 RepID=UPI0013CB7090|nr:DUF1330 domain-containing protein [Caulobacter sp. 17J65-9]NEX94455.1 DUF1330 domain-containing protein [Caulobacter sp. 17J65-9]
MPAYLLAQLKFKDRDAYGRYLAAFGAVFARFEGEVLVADKRPQVLEGEWSHDKVVLLKFPDEAAALRFRESDEYQAISEDRRAGADTIALLLAGR